MARRNAKIATPGARPILLTAVAPTLTQGTAPATSASVTIGEGKAPVLPPPTKAQVHYWRELAGAVSAHGAAGLRDEEWPADLAPSRPTLRALVERKILARRGRAWHLRRGWFATLSELRWVAVDAPALQVADRPAPGLPTYAELQACEVVCRWLDMRLKSRARLPFAGLELEDAEPGLPIETLRLMRRYKLVRHTAGCEWALARRWKPLLLGLWDGLDAAARRLTGHDPAPAPSPVSLIAGIDTWHLNWCAGERAIRAGTMLPARLRARLDELQERAREDEAEVETPWRYDGAPLRMYRWGTKAERAGAGVSWSYVLVNPSLRLLIRRAPLGGIVAQARLGSECLWRLTPRRALDELDALVRRMWAAPGLGRGRDEARWQVSQVHLAHDVMHAPLELEQLSRYVSRSRTRAVYEAARRDVESLLADLDGGETEGDLPLAVDWDALYADEQMGTGWDGGTPEGDDEEPAGDRAVTAYAWGRRLSGVTFSPGGATSVVLYDKTLEQRLRGRATMEPLWRSAGWDGASAVTRHEVRLRRDALRLLRLVGREAQPCLDDPWQFLDHQRDAFAAVVGRAHADAEGCPDATEVAWLRRVVPSDDESNRSRWATDPAWRVVQAAPFADAPADARRLVRRHQRARDVATLDASVYGSLVSRVALLHPEGGTWDISRAIREAADALVAESEKPEKDFGTLVRERRKARGLAVPPPEKVLPFHAAPPGWPIDPSPLGLDAAPADEADASARGRHRAGMAEVRVAQAWLVLAEAERRCMTGRTVADLEAAFVHEMRTLEAARAVLASAPQAGDG